nr:lipid A deacylase LpxR family protein [uncultured Flavobacterium sp.]
MPRQLWCIVLLCGFFGFAQKPSEAGIITENDLYTSLHNDQYYTNGLELFYRYLGNHSSEAVAKKIWEFRVGQYMYNPQSVYASEPPTQDRPYAGYLFLQGGGNTFYSNESLLKVNAQLGVVGPESGAEEAQKFLHNLLHYPRVRGWKYQITTTPAVQLNAFYSHKLLPNTFKENVDFHVQAEAQAGTIWRSATLELTSRISLKGALKPLYESALYNAQLNKAKDYTNRRELFLYVNPRLQYMNFDATIQGSLFDDKSPVTYTLIPFRFNAEAGIKYGRGRFTYSYSFNYRSKELRNNVITGYYYGSIQVGYLF